MEGYTRDRLHLESESAGPPSLITFWESEVAIRAFAGDDISVAKYYDFDKDFLVELEPCSAHYEMYDR
jgi:hypothetical protein